MGEVSSNDIRASVAAGVITEAQAARILSVSHERQGFRSNMDDEDEPFELFKGFSEIFVTVGLALLTGGITALTIALGNPVFIPLVSVAVSVLFARYFTLRRRMTLPSIFLTTTFGVSVFASIFILIGTADMPGAVWWLVMFAATAVSLAVYFRVFRTPFTMFLVGLCGVGAAYSFSAMMMPVAFHREGSVDGLASFLNLEKSPVMALTLLAFGLLAFVAAMRFDLRDPFRVSRHAASAFWLHILAAPAIVNVISASLLGIGGSAGYLIATLALAAVTMVALVIDRRSFLTAGIVYIGIILAWAINSTSLDEGWGGIWTLLIMGAFITWLGASWVPMRSRLMRALPDFPLKNRLPPYSET